MSQDAGRVFRLVTERASDAIWVVTCAADGAVALEYANPACVAVLGAAPSVAGWLDALTGVDRAAVHEAWDAFVADGGEFDVSCLVAPAGGAHRELRIRGFTADPTPEGDGRRVMVARDLTAERAEDGGRRTSETMFRLIADSLPGYVAYVSADDLVYRFVNRQFERGFGRPRAEIEGRHIRELIGEANYAFALPFIAQVRAGQATHYENCFQLAAGPAWSRVNYVPDFDGDGRVVGIVVLTYDVSEARRAAAERLLLEQQLQQAQKMEAIGKLAGGVAHDVNNVLAAITGIASLLEMELPAASQAASLVGELLAVSRRGADLTRNLLGFARKGRYQQEPTSVHALIAQTMAMLERTIAKDVSLQSALDADPDVVDGDPSQLAQALLNVLLNAVDAVGSRGTVGVRTSLRALPDGAPWPPELPPGPYVFVAVTDDGAGMDAETVRRATEPFFTTKAIGQGTGLGLAMVEGTVRAHGGALDIESALGRGTTVTLALPASSARARGRTVTVAADAPPVPVRETVLLVEDEPIVRRALARLLDRLGFEVREAANGLEAVEHFTADPHAVALVVLDMIMPVMDGAQAFDRIRALAPAVPILLCTGHQDETLTARILAHEGVALLCKPFDAEQLSQAIAHLRGR